MYMTKMERNQKIIAALRARTAEATVSTKAARETLIKDGIYTASGELSPEFGGEKMSKKKNQKNQKVA